MTILLINIIHSDISTVYAWGWCRIIEESFQMYIIYYDMSTECYMYSTRG